MTTRTRRFTIGHLFAGCGGGAVGAMRGRARLGRRLAEFRTIGGVDFDAGSCADFEQLVGATCLQADVHELQPADLRRAWGPRCPDMILTSAPCKGFSRLLPRRQAETEKYQRMNQLALVGTHLILSAWAPAVPKIIFFENVAGILSRGHDMLIQLRGLLIAHGYRVAEGVHDCGEVGGLAQRRRRWFMVARHAASLPRVVYLPPKRRVRACGEVLGELPLPLDRCGGPMHKMPRIARLTWARLALIPPGGDWRDLPGVVPEGKPRREVHRRHPVTDWGSPANTITTPGGANGTSAVGDPRIPLGRSAAGAGGFKGRPGLYGVNDWGSPAPTMAAGMEVAGSNTPSSVADPRLHPGIKVRGYTCNYQLADWELAARTVTGATRPGSGSISVADPRLSPARPARAGTLGVADWTEPSATVTASGDVQNGQGAVGDPRAWRGTLGVLDWAEPAGTVTGGAAPTRGRFSVGDPRVRFDSGAIDELLTGNVKRPPDEIPIIIGPWGTWNRPLTTLEIAALMGFDVRLGSQWLELSGKSSTAWRQRLGNAIPPPAAQSVADQMLRALLAGAVNAADELALDPVWVRPWEYGAVAA